jgi:hypothetical protein
VRVEPGDEVVHHLGLLRLVEDLVVEPPRMPDNDSFDDAVAKIAEHPLVLGTGAARLRADVVVDVAIDDKPSPHLSESFAVCQLAANTETVTGAIGRDARVDSDV